MEPRDGRTLMRTMSFISSRAKAIKQRFVPTQRSLSDTWQDNSTEIYSHNEPRMLSPELGGSMLSLLGEPQIPWQHPELEQLPSTTFRAQRSRSLDSLGSLGPQVLSPSSTMSFQCQSTLPSSPPRYQFPPALCLPITQPSTNQMSSTVLPPVSAMPGSSTSLSSCLMTTPIPYIPQNVPIRLSATAPTTPIKMAPSTTPIFLDPFSSYVPRFPDICTPENLSLSSVASPKRSRPSSVMSVPSSPLTSNFGIPRIPGPPPSPKASRPSTPKNVDILSDSLFMPHSPKPSLPSTPKQSEFYLLNSPVIPRIPGPPLSPKHNRSFSPKQIDFLIDIETNNTSPCISTTPPSNIQLSTVSTGAIPKIPRNQANLTVTCLENNFPPPREFHSASKVNHTQRPKKPATLTRAETCISSNSTSAKKQTSTVADSLKISQGDSFDHEENRDKVTEKSFLSRPSLFDPRARPKLKHQWSVDDSRTKEIGLTSCFRHLSDSSTSLASISGEPLKPAEKRRLFFMRKQTNSAPDSFDGPSHSGSRDQPPHKEHHSVSFCLGNVRKCRGSDSSILQPNLPEIKLEPELGVEHLGDLRYPDADPPCHFCCQQTSTAIHDENRLKIVSGGLIRSRDGSRDDTGTHYMNLPSPNVQNDSDRDVVFPRNHDNDNDLSDEARARDEIGADEEPPPPSALARRRALVPAKLLTDVSPTEKNAPGGSSDCSSPRNRRSSIVVIPPMQICPGDLLVYSKVLTHRNNVQDMAGSTNSLAVADTDANARKGKNTWSLLKLFERATPRAKSGSLCGMEEVLNCLQKIEFSDEQLTKFRGMCWPEFVAHVEGTMSQAQAAPNAADGASTSKENVPPAAADSAPPGPLPPSKARRLHSGLQRAQSERCFERRIVGGTKSAWKGGSDRNQPVMSTPIEGTVSEKDLLVSPVSTTSRAECKRREAVWDLFQSECAFLYDHLMVLKNVFMEPLKKLQVEGFAMFAEPELLFGNLDDLCCVTHAFCKEFIKLLVQNVGPNGELPTTEVLVRLFRKSSEADSVAHAYHSYALNYINALNYLETLRRHLEFCEFEKWCNRDSRCKKLQLTDLLVAPVQHIMKVPLILKEVETRTEEPAERVQITEILEVEEHSIRELDDKMKWLKNFERLLEIQRNIVWPSVFELDPKVYVPEFLKPALTRQPCDRIIVSPRRQIIIEGPLQLWDTGKPQEMYVILFDDMLLITRRKKGLSKKKSSLSENWASSCSRGSSGDSAMRYVVYKQPLSLDRFFIHEVTVPESASCRLEAAFILVSLNRFQQIVTIHTFQAPTDQSRQTWLLRLRDTQDKWKRTLQNTVFRSPRLSSSSAAGTPRKKSDA